jgi:hypothetical protein
LHASRSCAWEIAAFSRPTHSSSAFIAAATAETNVKKDALAAFGGMLGKPLHGRDAAVDIVPAHIVFYRDAGSIIGRCMPRHRAHEFRKFLNEIEQNVPVGLDIHVVMDNASTHKTKLIRSWFARRPHWDVHFTPTSSSWINQVERFFALLETDQARRT